MNKKHTFILLLCAISSFANSQSTSILDKISFKTAYTFSLTQRGISPFSKTRPFRRGVSSILFNLQYVHSLSENTQLSLGLQSAERGFKHVFIFQNQFDSTYSTYEHRLQYLELPITFIYHYKKWGIIIGATPSYLYHSDHRTYYDLSRYYNPNGTLSSYHVGYMATKHSVNRFNRWDLGGIIGLSRNIYRGIEIEFLAQKQFIFADAIFPNSRDIAYFITLSAGLRYHFLSNNY